MSMLDRETIIGDLRDLFGTSGRNALRIASRVQGAERALIKHLVRQYPLAGRKAALFFRSLPSRGGVVALPLTISNVRFFCALIARRERHIIVEKTHLTSAYFGEIAGFSRILLSPQEILAVMRDASPSRRDETLVLSFPDHAIAQPAISALVPLLGTSTYVRLLEPILAARFGFWIATHGLREGTRVHQAGDKGGADSHISIDGFVAMLRTIEEEIRGSLGEVLSYGSLGSRSVERFTEKIMLEARLTEACIRNCAMHGLSQTAVNSASEMLDALVKNPALLSPAATAAC